MNPDGTVNTVGWHDFSERSVHVLAEKSKATAKAFYGKVHKFAYWNGYSTGGRQALKLAQNYPNDFDGILGGAPAINWTKFQTSVLYSQIVMKQDLGGNMAAEKLTALSQVAVNECDGGEPGFVIDPLSCRYDPTKDAGVVCTSEVSTVRGFYRFYLIPGFGHREPVSGKTFVPLPQSAAGREEMFTALQK